jgi:hypothetical protein
MISCDLECQNGGTCELADDADTLTGNGGSSSMVYSNQTASINGMRCSCPTDYTGALCEVVSENSCDGANRPCYNNGQCVSAGSGAVDEYGNAQMQCDCSSAVVNGVQHVGTYCEHAVTEFCDDAKTIFCIRGTCNRDYP